MTTDENKAKAEEFKAKGNALFSSKNYVAAIEEYTNAISLDPKNAILFSNRAACRMATNSWLDAANDAETAVTLDPQFSKAWSRKAATHEKLGRIDWAAEAWQKACDTMPKANLTPAQIKQKEQYEAGLAAAKAAVAHAESQPQIGGIMMKDRGHPWTLAAKLVPGYLSSGRLRSSAFLITEAYKDFHEGITYMAQIKQTIVNGQPATMGHTGALTSFSNGVMRDIRTFHISSGDFISKYNMQIVFEAQKFRAWTHDGPAKVIQEVQTRQRAEGWDSARQALTTTVRSWIMRGCLEGGLRAAHDVELTFLTNAVEVLNWGREAWKDVPELQRGIIFGPTFTRSAKSMQAEAYMKAYSADPAKYSLEKLNKLADDILAELNADPQSGSGMSPGFFLSFVVYPRGHALSLKGFYHSKKATLLSQRRGDSTVIMEHLQNAVRFYVEAAHTFPPDDESTIWFLKVSLDNAFGAGFPYRDILVITDEIRAAVPDVLMIWRNSVLVSQGALDQIQKLLTWDKGIKQKIAANELTLDSVVRP